MDLAADPAPAMARLKLSAVALLGIAVIGDVVLASIFAYILAIATMPIDSRLWWMGLVSFLFALPFYLLYAGTGDRRIVRSLAGGFFLLGAGSFYGSIFLNSDSALIKLIWLVILSVVVVGVLGGILKMARDAEADAARLARRKVIR